MRKMGSIVKAKRRAHASPAESLANKVSDGEDSPESRENDRHTLRDI
jgi:hypothetical protein